MAWLKLWEPHLTIGSEIDIPKKELKKVVEEIKSVTLKQKPFTVKINDYEYMDNWSGGKMPGFTRFVIYLNIIKTPKLVALAKAIKSKVTDKHKRSYDQPWPYVPHITLAYKDLTAAGFKRAKKFLQKQKFSASMQIDHVALAIEKKGGKCVEYKRFIFPK